MVHLKKTPFLDFQLNRSQRSLQAAEQRRVVRDPPDRQGGQRPGLSSDRKRVRGSRAGHSRKNRHRDDPFGAKFKFQQLGE